jgi:hypothetical protein
MLSSRYSVKLNFGSVQKKYIPGHGPLLHSNCIDLRGANHVLLIVNFEYFLADGVFFLKAE